MGTLAEKLDYLSETKDAIKQSLINRGCTISDSDTFRSYVNKLSELPSLPISITAVYTQTTTVTDADSLDVLRPDLVVTAYYGDGTTEVVTDYTLSGTLEVGTSTITASYKGKSDSFDVTVETSITYLYKWDFTQSMVDSVNGAEATIYGTATQDSTGLHFTSSSTGVYLANIDMTDKTIEVDITDMDLQVGQYERYLISNANSNTLSSSYNKCGALQYDPYGGWRAMFYTSASGSTKGFSLWNITNDKNLFINSTIKIEYKNHEFKLYKNDTLIGTISDKYYQPTRNNYLLLGCANTSSPSYNPYNITFTGVRIYDIPT